MDNTLLQKEVRIEYKENEKLFSCAGKVIKDEEGTLTICFTLYLDDPVDVLTIQKKDILHIEKMKL
jgi:hypothetical protein